MKTEIYIETTPDTGIYERLDLHDDEDIVLNLKSKDTNDIGKVYSTYTQTFTVPTKERNTRLLNFFFNPDVKSINFNKGRSVNAKIYINSRLFKVGYIIINDTSASFLNPEFISITFYTGASQLKDRIGEDTIASLIPYSNLFTWTDANVKLTTMNSYSNVITPLISQRRVFSYGDSAANDIKYNSATPTGVKYIAKEDLRPAIPLSKLIDSIKLKYNIDADISLDTGIENPQNVYNRLFVWCNNSLSPTSPKPMRIENDFGAYQDTPIPPIFPLTASTTAPHNWNISRESDPLTFDITRTVSSADTQRAEFTLQHDVSLTLGSSGEDLSIRYDFIDLRLTSPTYNKAIFSPIVTLKPTALGGTPVLVKFDVGFSDKYDVTPSEPLSFRVIISSNQSFTYQKASFTLLVYDEVLYPNGPVYGKNSINNTSNSMALNQLNLIGMVPNIKIIDLLDSFYKMFNIRVIEDNYSTKSYWVDAKTFEATQTIVDYSPHLSSNSSKMATQDVYKTYVLTHNTSKFYSNVNYKLANEGNPNSKEFGQLIYTTDQVYSTGEYKVATKFNIILPTVLKGMWYETHYGFTSDSPTVDGTGNSIYKPDYNELLIFYAQGSTRIYEREPLGGLAFPFRPYGYVGYYNSGVVESINTINYIGITNRNVSLLSGYYTDEDLKSYYENSLGFKDEVKAIGYPNIYLNNLYSNYYSNTIETLNNPYQFLCNFKVILSPTEIDDFKMSNKILIAGRKYSIQEAKINLTSGETDLKLINLI